jgi:hypothetical protein
MNWEAIGAVGEILGAVAVFLSLIYLAVQIRGSTKQSRAAMVQAIASDFAQTHDPYLLNSELAEIVVKLGDNETLSPTEQRQWESSLNRALNVYLAVQHAYDEGQLNEGYYQTICQDVERVAEQFPGWADGMRGFLAYYPEESKKRLWRSLY